MGHIKIRYPLALVLIALVCVGCNALKRTAYEGFDRNEWRHPEEVIRSLGLQAGGKVADLGLGSGYFTVRLASAVGSTGKVYAVDVDPDMNDYVAKRTQEEGFDNIEVILAEYDDPLLPEWSVRNKKTPAPFLTSSDPPFLFPSLGLETYALKAHHNAYEDHPEYR